VVSWDAAAGKGLVATAGHCFDADDDTDGCQYAECPFYFVFDFDDAASPGGVIPAANVFECTEIKACDLRKGTGLPYDYGVAEISADLAPGVPEVCNPDWENDDSCDVPTNCPDGTDLADCGQTADYDTPELQVPPIASAAQSQCAEISVPI
jgi:hypothetical protein